VGGQRTTSEKIVAAGEFIQELGSVVLWLAVVLVISVPILAHILGG
jgi:hypothetical protein